MNFYNFLSRISVSLIGFISLISSTITINAQGVYVPSHNKDYYHLLDRLDISAPLSSPYFHSSQKPADRQQIGLWVDSLSRDSSLKYSKQDIFNLQYLSDDNSEWSNYANHQRKGLLKTFFTNNADFYHVAKDGLDLHVNPVVDFTIGKDTKLPNYLYTNTRGVEVRGNIGKKIGFYSYLADNQAILPYYVSSYGNFSTVPGVPGEGYTKWFKGNGSDFITGRGYVTFNIIKNISAQFGHDRNFVGNGYRSMILSDFSSNYTFLKLNTKVWKLNYTNIFAQLVGDVFYRNEMLPKKYFAFHHLSVNVTKNINIGLFESVIFGRQDASGNGSFDINYMNPIIFYRSVEIQQGSPDNALLGMDYKINFLRRFSFYGQVVLDEFVLKKLMKNDGYYGNKYALQMGLKYINIFGVKNLDAQVEYNMARPYTYSHKDIYRNYAHYRMPLAHPLGANFTEVLGILRYQPVKRMQLTGKLFLTTFGSDTSYASTSGLDNFGGNVMKNYENASAVRPLGNVTGQGIKNNMILVSFNISWMLRHNLYLDFTQILRAQISSIASRTYYTSVTTAGIRWNIPQRTNEF